MLNLKAIIFILISTAVLLTGCHRYSYEGESIKPFPQIRDEFGSANASSFYEFQGKLYFCADDGVHGSELWVMDGDKQPVMAFDINRNEYAFGRWVEHGGSLPRYYVTYNEKLYFLARDNNDGFKIFCYDGVNAPAPVGNLELSDPGFFTVINGKFIYLQSDTDEHWRYQLWSYDGVSQPVKLTNFTASDYNYDPFPSWIVVQNGVLYCDGDDGVHGKELWAYDGNTPPHMVADLLPGGNGSYPGRPIVFRNKMYFNMATCKNPNGLPLMPYLYEFDGINSVRAISPEAGYYYPGQLTVFRDKLYFSAEDSSHGREIWSYDGTVPPALICDINPGPGDASVYGLIASNDRLYFTAYYGSSNRIWTCDGINPPEILTDVQGLIGLECLYQGRLMFTYTRRLERKNSFPDFDYGELGEYNLGTGVIKNYVLNDTVQKTITWFIPGGM